MKKIYTLLAAMATTLAMNAATVTATWQAADETDLANNADINDKTFTVDNMVSFVNAQGTATANNAFQKSSSTPACIRLQAHATLTVSAEEGAAITAIKFIVNTTEGNNATPEWRLTADSNTYDINNDTWTGNATSIEFTVGKVARITGITVTYETEGDVPVTPDPEPGEYKEAKLRFGADQVADGEAAQHVVITDNDVTIDFTTTATKPVVDANKGYFGNSEDPIVMEYRYRPGGKSSKGIDSPTKGVITVPCKGTFTIYAFNNQDDARKLEIVQNNETVFTHTFEASEAVEVPTASSTRKVYPIYTAKLDKGTAYLLWPDNQVMLYGFDFTPEDNTSGVEDIVVEDVQNMPAYDLYGRRVSDDYKGFVIVGGKKYLRR